MEVASLGLYGIQSRSPNDYMKPFEWVILYTYWQKQQVRISTYDKK